MVSFSPLPPYTASRNRWHYELSYTCKNVRA